MKRFGWLIALIGTLVGAILFVVAYIMYLLLAPTDQTNTAFVQEQSGRDGIIILDPAQPISDFVLLDNHGNNISLDNLRGKPAVLTFGFTHCPDICPLTLGEYRKIHADLAERSDDLNFVFVSVDGQRDTPDVLQDYFNTLDIETFVTGITGDPDAVRDFAWELGADFIYRQSGDDGFYSVDHTAGMFLLDENGAWIRRYSYGTPHGLIVNDIEEVINS